MADESMIQSLEAMIPKSLDDIVRKNREQARIHLATSEQLSNLMTSLPSADTYATIDDWRFISLSAPEAGIYRIRLLGSLAHNGDAWFTSVVRQIDIEQGLVMTQNNYYKLGEKGEGEPPFEQLACICSALHAQGAGEYLGVPPFFY